MKKLVFNLLLLILSLYFPIFLFDMGLQIYSLSTRKDNSDPRTKFEIVTELRKTTRNVYPAFGPFYFAKHPEDVKRSTLIPLSGVSNSTIVYSKEGGEWLIFQSDQFGFNNNGKNWGDYVRNGCNIVLIGDSFTQGGCAPSGQIFADLIRAKYPKTINLGTSSTGPIIQKGIFNEYAIAIRPKNIFWCYYEGNDLNNIEREKSWDAINKYLLPTYKQGLMRKQNEIDRFLVDIIERNISLLTKNKSKGPKYGPYYLSLRTFNVIHGLGLKHFRSFLNDRLKTDILFLPYLKKNVEVDHTENIRIFRNIIADVKNASSKWGGQIAFVYLPSHDSIYRRKGLHREKVLSFVRELGLPIIDLYEPFVRHENPKVLFNIPWGKHFSPEGHRVVAEHLCIYLKGKMEGS